MPMSDTTLVSHTGLPQMLPNCAQAEAAHERQLVLWMQRAAQLPPHFLPPIARRLKLRTSDNSFFERNVLHSYLPTSYHLAGVPASVQAEASYTQASEFMPSQVSCGCREREHVSEDTHASQDVEGACL